ncbi:hypothetical protein MASR2M70_02870 [Bacillota bacterium]
MLETERLILRPWNEGDAESLYAYAKDPQVGPIAGWPVHTSIENSRDIIKSVLAVPENYAVCFKEDNVAIGCVGLVIGGKSNIKLPDDEGEIGYWIGVPFWGRGLIPEAVNRLMLRAFEDLNIKKLWCGYFDGNIKSKRVQEKCGFKHKYTLKDIEWRLMNDIRTEHISCITLEEWNQAINGDAEKRRKTMSINEELVETEGIKCIKNHRAEVDQQGKVSVDGFSREVTRKVRSFHKSFPEYKVTPLRSLKELSKALRVESVWIKDESFRFGLNAFKVLGGSYSVGNYLAKRLNMDIDKITFDLLKSDEIRNALGDITFVTATDGNHGRGVAWAAARLGQKSVVLMPKGSAEIRLANIQKEGADARITDLNYDDTVRLAKEYAKEIGGVIIQDSVKEGYKEIPTWIMQGYTTIIDEVLEQLAENDCKAPTHVFLQAGVGAFAAAIAAYLVSAFGDKRPIIIVVEPDEAACFFLSVKAGDGEPHAVTGFMPTIMAGLACGEPCDLSWKILHDYGDFFISCNDDTTIEGMRTLAHPMQGDPVVVSGESGAVSMGLVKSILQKKEFEQIKKQLHIDENSRILCISTEGDTDPENYRKICGSL